MPCPKVNQQARMMNNELRIRILEKIDKRKMERKIGTFLNFNLSRCSRIVNEFDIKIEAYYFDIKLWQKKIKIF
jgi:hypothetical protein